MYLEMGIVFVSKLIRQYAPIQRPNKYSVFQRRHSTQVRSRWLHPAKLDEIGIAQGHTIGKSEMFHNKARFRS
jgi:hypothetical protein